MQPSSDIGRFGMPAVMVAGVGFIAEAGASWKALVQPLPEAVWREVAEGAAGEP